MTRLGLNSGELIQDFPEGGAPTSKVGVLTYFLSKTA